MALIAVHNEQSVPTLPSTRLCALECFETSFTTLKIVTVLSKIPKQKKFKYTIAKSKVKVDKATIKRKSK
jgi:hypothetical protein